MSFDRTLRMRKIAVTNKVDPGHMLDAVKELRSAGNILLHESKMLVEKMITGETISFPLSAAGARVLKESGLFIVTLEKVKK